MAFLNDGFPTTIDFDLAPTVKFKEKTITPPGMDGGGPNKTSTMRNIRYHTKQPKGLIDMSAMTTTVSYDPECYDSVEQDLLNKNGQVTINFPDGSMLTVYGWLDKFMPQEISEGEQPEAEITIEISNQDDDGNEVAPDYQASTGT